MVAVKRSNLSELEDQEWFPKWMRAYQMDFLGYLAKYFKVYKPCSSILNTYNPKNVLDLASGNGMAAKQSYASTSWDNFEFRLSDKFYSDKKVFHLDILENELPDANLYTMYNSLHHFNPEQINTLIGKILKTGNKFAFFEPLQPNFIAGIKVLTSTLILPFFMVPFMRPFRWDRIVLTYLIPIGPVICLYDGLISVSKSYTTKDLKKIIGDCGSKELKSGILKSPMANITYISG